MAESTPASPPHQQQQKSLGQAEQLKAHSPKPNTPQTATPTQQHDSTTTIANPQMDPNAPPHPFNKWYWRASFFSFDWLDALVFKGLRKKIDMSDVPNLQASQLSSTLSNSLHNNFARFSKFPRVQLLLALNSVFGVKFWLAGLFKFLQDLMQLVGPGLLYFLIKFVDTDKPESEWMPLWKGIVVVVSLVLSQILNVVCSNMFQYLGSAVRAEMRSALIAAVYQKSLRLSVESRSKMKSADVLSLLSIEAQKIADVSQYFHMAWTSVSFLILVIVMLCVLLGPAGLLAAAVIFLWTIPLNFILARRFGYFRKKAMHYTDLRSRLLSEILNNIRVIKFFGWEEPFSRAVQALRKKELMQYFKLTWVRSGFASVTLSSPSMMALLVFVVYVYAWNGKENAIQPEVAFPAVAYLNLTIGPLIFMVFVLSACIEALLGINRIQDFLTMEERADLMVIPLPENVDEIQGNDEAKRDNLSVLRELCDNQQRVFDQKAKMLHQVPPKVPDPRESDFDIAVKVTDGNFEWVNTSLEEVDAKRPKLRQRLLKKLGLKKGDEVHVEHTKVSHNSSESPHRNDNTHAESPHHTENTQTSTHGTLSNINLTIPRGSLTCIVGSVGSGKSSLLQALLGEMKHISGNVRIAARIDAGIAYCAQEAWLQTASLRDNILFGKEYNEKRYREVLRICQLLPDLKILANGDQTEIGSKGLNLSGGQRQRVSIARSTYSDADIYLLDDILSALDQHVGRALFDSCINGHLSGKTRILVTHQLQYLPAADQVIVMDHGKIAEHGSYDELMDKKGLLHQLIEEHMAKESEEDKKRDEEARQQKADKKQQAAQEEEDNEPVLSEEEIAAREKRGKLISKEEKSKGGFSAIIVFFRYLHAMGSIPAVILILGIYALAHTSLIAYIWWLAMWIQGNFNLSVDARVGVFAGLAVVPFVGMMLRSAVLFCSCLLASLRLHDKMFRRIIRAPMSFFDTTPVGRILNRATTDMEVVDSFLPGVLMQFLASAFQLIVVFVLMEVAIWMFFIPLLVISIFFLGVVFLYRSSATELKRLESINRSPLFSHTGESLTGVSTIRAFQQRGNFVNNNGRLTDNYTRPFYFQLMVMRWLGFRVEGIGAFIIIIAGVFLLVLREMIEPTMIGLGMTFGMLVSFFLANTIIQSTELESEMNSVERVDEYTRNTPLEPLFPPREDNEHPEKVTKRNPPANWPQEGRISFQNYYMRYRPDLDPVLNGLTLDIKGGEHIGIVGRTGAGKSSIMLTLYRMVEASAGRIEIDGVNISELHLHPLRRSLSIIPQDPVLFSGTIRSNLDPFREHTDAQLWSCIESAHLKDVVSSLPMGIDAPVSEGGSNFSVGQRQLLCLARALATKTKILICDEATASVDLETDALIQKTIRDQFSDCTTLTIAHRLNTIIDADRILVLEKGEVAEFDTPRNLVLREDSMLNALISDTGSANARTLRDVVLGKVDKEAAKESLKVETVLVDENEEEDESVIRQRDQDFEAHHKEDEEEERHVEEIVRHKDSAFSEALASGNVDGVADSYGMTIGGGVHEEGVPVEDDTELSDVKIEE